MNRFSLAAAFSVLAAHGSAHTVQAQQLAIDVEVGVAVPSIDTRYVTTGPFLGAVTFAAPLRSKGKAAWVGAGQLFAITISGENADCALQEGTGVCIGHIDMTARGALFTGGAFDIGGAELRALAGVTVFSEERRGSRPAPTVRVDFSLPANRTFAFVASGSHAMLGSLYGRQLNITNMSVGVRLRPTLSRGTAR